jgi:hypothetical protein
MIEVDAAREHKLFDCTRYDDRFAKQTITLVMSATQQIETTDDSRVEGNGHLPIR